MKFFRSSLFFYLVLLGLIECLVTLDFISKALVPRPTDVLAVFVQQPEVIFPVFFRTASLAAVAYVFSSGFAFLLALILHHYKSLQKKLMPLALFFQTVPVIAIAPLLVIYMGFGIPSILTAALIVCFFPVFASTLVGLSEVNKNQAELFQFLKAKTWQKLLYLEIPTSIPHVLAGLKASAGLSVVGVVSGEFVAGGGLGGLIDSARLQQRVDLLFAALVVLSLTGLSLMKVTEKLFRLIFKSYFVS